MRLLYWLITAPLLVFAVSFAVSNRDDVSLSLWPLPFEITVPLAAVGLIAMLLGAFIGMFITWANASKTRSRARQAQRQADTNAREVSRLKDQLKTSDDAQPSLSSQQVVETSNTKSVAGN